MNIEHLDFKIAHFMERWGKLALRISLGIIFFWFGILKAFEISPAASLVEATINWLPLLGGSDWVKIVGWWEVVIGLFFLSKKTIRIAIALLAIQMVGTILPLFIFPEVTFQQGRIPYAPTLEGQYIIKNLLIISAALVIGGTVKKGQVTV
ncbi:DoxX family membrane protein [Catalinimonas sp. 4WD22]|uniref:DoxX family membrane protein n=1 Tax=Catalinimonas locisalis TaxID=3133978 RepID=UPI003100F385